MRKDGLKISNLLISAITHVHPDHAYMSNLTKKKPNCMVRCHPAGVEILCAMAPWKTFLEKEKQVATIWAEQVYKIPEFLMRFGLQIYFGKWYPSVERKRVRVLKDGESIDLTNCRVKTIFSPGHTEDGIAYLIPKEKALISGDLLYTDKKMGIPCFNTFSANFNHAISTIKKYQRLARSGKIETLLPGHGAPIIKNEQKILQILSLNLKNCQKLKKRARQFLKEHKILKPKKLTEAIDDLLPSDISGREKILMAFVLAKALGRA